MVRVAAMRRGAGCEALTSWAPGRSPRRLFWSTCRGHFGVSLGPDFTLAVIGPQR